MGEEKSLSKIGLKSGKRLILPLSIIGIVLTAGVAIYTFRNANREVETATPAETTPEIKAVTALGRLEPQGEIIQLSPPPDLGGTRIGEILVAEGDRVTKGQTVAILDNYNRSAAAVERVKQEVKVAQADLAIVKAGAKTGTVRAQEATIKQLQAELQEEIAANKAQIASLEARLAREVEEKQAARDRYLAELNNAESEFQRYQQLATEGVISDSELDTRRLSVDTARERLAEARASYNRTMDTLETEIEEAKANARQQEAALQEQIVAARATLDEITEVRDVDVQKAQAEVDRAIAALKEAEEDLKLTYVKAPIAGRVIEINAYPGETVPQEEGVIELGQTDKMVAIAEVYESDINKVSLGQPATIRSQTGAFAGELKGTVSQIGLKIGKQDVLDTDPAADVDSRVVEVEVRLDEEDSQKVDNLSFSKVVVKIDTDT